MLSVMDGCDSRRVDGSGVNEHCFGMMIRQGSEFSIKS